MTADKDYPIPKIHKTRNYDLFVVHNMNNREMDARRHKALKRSMEEHGFLPFFPIVCGPRNAIGEWPINDGQHRFLFAKELELPIYWIEDTVGFDVAEINCTGRTWTVTDFARRWQNAGKDDYGVGLDFVDRHGLSPGVSFAMLAGNTNFSNIEESFKKGRFEVRDKDWAEAVGGLYTQMRGLGQAGFHNARCLSACMAVCRVAEFDAGRFIHNAKRCREKLIPLSTRKGYLLLMEEIYNYGRSRRTKVFLEHLAQLAMDERDAALRKQRESRDRKGAGGEAA